MNYKKLLTTLLVFMMSTSIASCSCNNLVETTQSETTTTVESTTEETTENTSEETTDTSVATETTVESIVSTAETSVESSAEATKATEKNSKATPTPTKKAGATNTPAPTKKPGATNTPTPTRKPGATATPTPTATPKPTATPTKAVAKCPYPNAEPGSYKNADWAWKNGIRNDSVSKYTVTFHGETVTLYGKFDSTQNTALKNYIKELSPNVVWSDKGMTVAKNNAMRTAYGSKVVNGDHCGAHHCTTGYVTECQAGGGSAKSIYNAWMASSGHAKLLKRAGGSCGAAIFYIYDYNPETNKWEKIGGGSVYNALGSLDTSITRTPTSTPTPKPTSTPKPTEETEEPKATATPKPTSTPTPKPTATPKPTEAPSDSEE